MGGSAGGLDAYIRLLTHLPTDLGVAVVIVNHITSMPTRLHEILPRYTHMPVELITERLCIQPNHVFVIPENRDLHVLHGEFRLKPISKPRGWPRKLPRQGDSIKGELPAVCRALNRDGGTRPKASWGRSSLYSRIHSALISRT